MIFETDDCSAGGTISLSDKITLSTKTAEVLPDVKMHFTLQREGSEAGAADGGRTSGFYEKPLRVPTAGRWILRSVAMHSSMLPSSSSTFVFDCTEQGPGVAAQAVAESASRWTEDAAILLEEPRGESDKGGAMQPRVRVAGCGAKSTIRPRRTRGVRSDMTPIQASDIQKAVSMDWGQMIGWFVFAYFALICVHRMMMAMDIIDPKWAGQPFAFFSHFQGSVEKL